MKPMAELLKEIDRRGMIAFFNFISNYAEIQDAGGMRGADFTELAVEEFPELVEARNKLISSIDEIEALKPPFDAARVRELYDETINAFWDYEDLLSRGIIELALPWTRPGGMPALLRRLADEIEKPDAEDGNGGGK